MQIVFTPGNIFEVKSIKSGPNKVSRKALYYNGVPAYLAGIFPPTARLDGTDGEGGFKDGQFTYIMDDLFNQRNNFFRHYLTNYFLYDPDEPTNKTPTGEDPRKRYCPFQWLPDKKQWDLTRFNEDYFNRLRAMIWQAREHVIYVQLTLFDGAGMRFKTRWPFNPWNAKNNINEVVANDLSAMPDFYNRKLPAKNTDGSATTLGAIQDGFINKVLQTVNQYGNVCYEIMNEPTEGTPEKRSRWADQIVGTINGTTRNRRLIFYNDHSQAEPDHVSGKDVNKWQELNLPNYGALDGVIIHGDPNLLDPDQKSDWLFRGDKVIQASSDTVDAVLREQRDWNQKTARNCFQRHIVYQAEANTGMAAYGIRLASPATSFITPMRALGAWDLTSAGNRFNLRFEATGRFLAFDPVNDIVINQGKLVDFDGDYFKVLQDGQTQPVQFLYGVTSDGQNLYYRKTVEGSPLFQFIRFPVDLEPFLFGWEKIAEDPVSNWPRYFLYFRKNGAAVSFAARDPQNPQNIINQGTVTSIASYPPKIKMASANGEVAYDYTFTNNGSNLRLFANGRRQDFKRRV